MSDENTQIKDLTEVERLMIGSSINLVYNIISNQINHIEHHDPELIELLNTNELAQEDYITLQNLRDVANQLTKLFGNTFSTLSDEEKESLSQPATKLEIFFEQIFNAVSCNDNS